MKKPNASIKQFYSDLKIPINNDSMHLIDYSKRPLPYSLCGEKLQPHILTKWIATNKCEKCLAKAKELGIEIKYVADSKVTKTKSIIYKQNNVMDL